MTVPKVELHVHLIGTVAPALARRLAARHGMTLPDWALDGEAAWRWTDFHGFMRAFDAAAATVRTPEDYRDVTYAYLAEAASHGAIYVELQSSPQGAFANGLSYRGHCDGIAAGIADARAEFGIEASVIAVAQRHRGVESAEQVAGLLEREPHPVVRGFGLAGDEAGWPPAQFARAFAIAAGAGCGITAHAGEMAGPDGIRAALAHLKVTRIGHGVRAIEDQALIAELIERGTTLEVCPDSNIAIGLYRGRDEHPFPALDRAGVKVTLNSDDPPHFGSSIGKEYADAAGAWGYSDADLRRFTRNAIEASFAPPDMKARLAARV